MDEVQKKERTVMLLKEFFSGNISEQRENDILQEVGSLVPDPYFLDYIFHSDEFWDENGNFDYEGVVEKGFNYKPNVIAL